MDVLYIERIWIMVTLLVIIVPVLLILWKKTDKKHLYLLGHALFLIWAARFIMCIQDGFYKEDLNLFEKLFDSLVHALQTFSMDEDYTRYTAFGKEWLQAQGYGSLAVAYGIGISILNVCAPILGGALLLDIVMGFFPDLQLLVYKFRHKFVFSELNAESIALAEDICKDQKYRNLIRIDSFDRTPVILFSDAYHDDESELSSELYGRAKAIGAICVKKDILQLSLRHSKSVNYFLIDADAHANISTLTQLLKPDKKGKQLWPIDRKQTEPVTRIFVFGQDDSGNAMIRQVCAEHQDVYENVLVRPIQDQMNAAINLMYEVPLFLPLLSKPERERSDIHVTVLGSGELAEEAFKSAYWCGQIASARLHLNVLAPDASAMEQRIAEKYPELLDSCTPGAALLRIRPHGPDNEVNPPYCEKKGFHDVEDIFRVSSYPADVLKNTDYYIVALGNDKENLQVANQLKILLAREALQADSVNHPVIAPAVEDQGLVQAVQILEPGRYEPYFVPFASRESRYSCKNVFLTSFTEHTITIKSIYQKKHQQKDRNDIYATQSSAARAVHAPYKLFDLGLLRKIRLTDSIEKRYLVPEPDALTSEQEDLCAWVEHRRWNAYMRAQGFTCPSREQYLRIFMQTGATKSIPLKLHPCLVESGIKPTPLKVLASFSDPRYDYLDYVTMYTYRIKSRREGKAETNSGLREGDYKKYDYLSYDAAVDDLLIKKKKESDK